jgi:hypothetical protein
LISFVGSYDQGRKLMERDVLSFLEGLASYKVIFTKVKKGTKRTLRTWDHYENLHNQRGESRLDLVYDWLRNGFGVGYLLRNRLAAIDADSPETVKRIMEFEDRDGYIHFPKVQTPGGGVHALFLHPADMSLSNLKNHVCHPLEDGVRVPWDFKLGERTMLMAPGTVMPKGTYQPGIWSQPPTLDVRFIAPTIEIYRHVPEYLKDIRPKNARILAAMNYLRLHAPVSVEGKGRRRALTTVARHLVGYYDLDPSLAFHLLVTSKHGTDREGSQVEYSAWNLRCLDKNGKSAAWDDDHLWDALEEAVDQASAYGVKLYEEAQEKEFARWAAAAFLEMLTYLPEPKGNIWIGAEALYRLFIEFTGVKPAAFQKCELGNEMAIAIKQGRLPFMKPVRTKKARGYFGLNVNTLEIAIDRFEATQKILGQAV